MGFSSLFHTTPYGVFFYEATRYSQSTGFPFVLVGYLWQYALLMEYRRCGNSGLLLPVLSLGGWHNFTTLEQAKELTLAAFDQGITHIDLANNYGPPGGIAETQVGRILETDLADHRDELIISSKAGYKMWDGPYGDWGSKKYLTASLDQSLKRLGLAYVDIFYHHRYDPSTPLEETMGALHQAVRAGKALYPAISNYPEKAVRKAAKMMSDWGTPLLAHQCPYSMFNRSIELGVMQQSDKRGMGMVAFSSLAQGMLTDRYLSGIPADSRAANPDGFLQPDHITEAKLKIIRSLHELASERGQSLSRLALQWCLRKQELTTVIIGASKADQIRENLEILNDAPLNEEYCLRIDGILEE
jgi:L-glyceraldehyde 3-phosphate reductase